MHHVYRSYFDILTNGDGSPFKGMHPFTYSEFLWAFATVLNRTLPIHDYDMKADPDFRLVIMPLFDFLNHSPSPNVGVVPHHEDFSDKSFFRLVSLEDIPSDTQLTVSYGPKFSNMELMIKYGFTLPSQSASNFMAPFY